MRADEVTTRFVCIDIDLAREDIVAYIRDGIMSIFNAILLFISPPST